MTSAWNPIETAPLTRSVMIIASDGVCARCTHRRLGVLYYFQRGWIVDGTEDMQRPIVVRGAVAWAELSDIVPSHLAFKEIPK